MILSHQCFFWLLLAILSVQQAYYTLHRYMKDLEKGLSVPSMMYVYSPGGSILNHTFL